MGLPGKIRGFFGPASAGNIVLPQTRGLADYDSRQGWASRRQPALHEGIHDNNADAAAYRQQAVDRVPAFDAIIQAVTNKFGFKVESSGAVLKKEDSAIRKMWARSTQHPGQADTITDYLRAKIIVPDGPSGVTQLAIVMNTLISHPQTRAIKDQFFTPEAETGFRSFKAIMEVDGHLSEMMVDYGGMKIANKLTEDLRSFERQLSEKSTEVPERCVERNSPDGRALMRLQGPMEMTITNIRGLRKTVNDVFAEEHGLNILLDPKLVPKHTASAEELARQITAAVAVKYVGHQVGAIIKRAGLEIN